MYKPCGRSRVKDHSYTITFAFCLAGFSTTNLNSLSISPRPTVLLFTHCFQRLWALKVCSLVILQASSSVDQGNSGVRGKGFENASWCIETSRFLE